MYLSKSWRLYFSHVDISGDTATYYDPIKIEYGKGNQKTDYEEVANCYQRYIFQWKGILKCFPLADIHIFQDSRWNRIYRYIWHIHNGILPRERGSAYNECPRLWSNIKEGRAFRRGRNHKTANGPVWLWSVWSAVWSSIYCKRWCASPTTVI